MTRNASLKPFIGLIRRHWLAMAIGTALALMAMLAAVGLLSLSGWFLAAAAFAGLDATAAKAFNFFLPSIGVRLLAMTRTATRYAERIVCHDATFRILETLRTWCFKKIEPLSPARIGKQHSGDLLSRLITDIDTLDSLYLRVLSPTVVAFMAALCIIAGIALINMTISLVSAGVLAMTGIGLPLLATRWANREASRLNLDASRMRTALVDGIHGLAALLTCGAEKRYLQQMKHLDDTLIRRQGKMNSISGLAEAAHHLIFGLAVVATLVIGSTAVSQGQLSGPLLALLVLVVMASADSVAPLAAAYQFLGQTRTAANRLTTVTSVEPAVIYPTTSPTVIDHPDISFRRVTFGYASTGPPAVSDIDMSVAPGARVAVMGPTGAGKSTLLYLLARFEDPQSGEIRLGQTALQQIAEKDLRRLLCIVDQRAHIFNGSIRDNLLLADPGATVESIAAALEAVALDDFINDLPRGLDTWVGEGGRMLSGGQAKRLSIARAMLSRASILVLDEPTEGLDPATASTMMNRLLDLAPAKTVIIVTHRAEAIWRMDHVIMMQHGRIAATGTPDGLFHTSPLFIDLVKPTRPET